MSTVIHLDSNNPSSIISEADVTVNRLLAILSNALFDVELDDDNDIYVKDGLEFPVWIRLSPNDRLLQMFTYASTDDDKKVLSFADINQMNSSIVLPQFSLQGKNVYGNFWLSYETGLPIKQFVKLLRRFSGAFVAGMRLRDTG